MLKVTILELCFRGFPECLLSIWAINLINMKKLNKKIWVLLSAVFAIAVYLVRMLPIQYGVHTLITVIFFVTSAYYISHISLVKAISSTLIVITLLSICEFLNFVIILYVFKMNIQKMFSVTWEKILATLPSLILFICFILIFNFVNRRNVMKGNTDNVSD